MISGFTGAADQRYPIQLNASVAKRPECEVDAWLMHLQSLGQGVVKIALHVFHDQEVAVAEADHPFLLGLPVPNGEVPRRSKRNAGDAGRVNFGFVVAVPPHGVLPVSVLVEEAGIEVTGGLSVDFHLLHKPAHLICEGGSRPLYARIPISRAHPSRQSRFGVRLAVHPNAVLLPRNGFRPMGQRYFVKCSADDPAGAGTCSQYDFLSHRESITRLQFTNPSVHPPPIHTM